MRATLASLTATHTSVAYEVWYMPVVLAFLLLLSVAACATQTDQQFELRLREMSGSDERGLLSSMGRIPDNTYQLDEDTRILQWRWDTSYIAGGWTPMYQRVGWGMWMPIGGFPPTLVRQGCIVEWTVTKGATQSFRWQGSGCNTVSIHSAPA
ncbi:hypothetical protein BH11PSE3_BH11PSE3_35880 [soil metagenome]